MNGAARGFMRVMLEAAAAMSRARLRAFQQQSPLTLLVLGGFVAGYLVIGFLIFHGALAYLDRFAVVGPLLARRVLFLVLGFFLFMLIFSNLVIGFAGLFRSRETAWLLTLPVEPRETFRWKLAEQIAVSSWALLFFTLPLIAAYAVVLKGGALFFAVAWVVLIPFVVLPGVLAVFIALAIARFFNPGVFKFLLWAGGAVALAVLVFLARPGEADRAMVAADLISVGALLKQSEVLAGDALPSAWVARTLLAVADQFPAEGFFYAWLLTSWAAAAWLIATGGGGAVFHDIWLRAADREGVGWGLRADCGKAAGAWRAFRERLLSLRRGLVAAIPLGADAKAMVIKDQTLFWREPAQWSQFLILFGLLGIYILNLRNLSVDITQPFWGTLISYLNLASASFTASTLTTRFVFPQFSQEGRRLWIIGMSGMGLPRMLWIKFWASAAGTGAVTVLLVTASSIMLKLPAATVAGFALAMALISCALSGLAVGLGALFPNLREESPAKIVSGFGGTLCLVLSFIFLLLFISLLALPAVFRLPAEGAPVFGANWPTAAAAGGCVLLSSVCAFVPMRLAARRVGMMDL